MSIKRLLGSLTRLFFACAVGGLLSVGTIQLGKRFRTYRVVYREELAERDSAGNPIYAGIVTTGATDWDIERSPWLRDVRELSIGAGPRLSRNVLERLISNPKLSDLDLNGGAIDDELMQKIYVGSPLRSLTIRNASITDHCMEHLGKLRELQYLELAGNSRFHGNSLGQLAHTPFHNLYFFEVPLSEMSIGEIGKLKTLRKLSLRATKIRGDYFDALSQLPELETLSIPRTALEKNILQLAKTPSLKEISIFGKHTISPEGLVALVKSLPRLQSIYMPDLVLTRKQERQILAVGQSNLELYFNDQ